MKQTDIAIVGGGPAGLCAAIAAAKLGAKVVLIDDNEQPGGQLVKQTHKFFGSKRHYCGTRGMDIAAILEEELRALPAEVLPGTSVVGLFGGNVLALASREHFTKLGFKCLIVATGSPSLGSGA